MAQRIGALNDILTTGIALLLTKLFACWIKAILGSEPLMESSDLSLAVGLGSWEPRIRLNMI